MKIHNEEEREKERERVKRQKEYDDSHALSECIFESEKEEEIFFDSETIPDTDKIDKLNHRKSEHYYKYNGKNIYLSNDQMKVLKKIAKESNEILKRLIEK